MLSWSKIQRTQYLLRHSSIRVRRRWPVPAHWLVEAYSAQLSDWSNPLGLSAGGSPHQACWSHGPAGANTSYLHWLLRACANLDSSHTHMQHWPGRASACWRSCSNVPFLQSAPCTQLAFLFPPELHSARWHPAVRCPAGPAPRPSLETHTTEGLMMRETGTEVFITIITLAHQAPNVWLSHLHKHG